ncbi:hypothetical protein [Scytonema millei]|uniref:Uncharacterized protein n=1 Tax=Scytonema millei VB511283 TaxID=1245923 RepID=A0A9X5I4Q6_9CYAN|nr:hypothetical protein [Scytonema millei]NHC35205.1 hypothetical protein [Scytonema millei VB511283]
MRKSSLHTSTAIAILNCPSSNMPNCTVCSSEKSFIVRLSAISYQLAVISQPSTTHYQ